jgi:hypothetical protein
LPKRGYRDQCSQEVWDKLEATDDWESMQKEHYPHELMEKIEMIFVGFANCKQEVFNLVQSPKTLFLCIQMDSDTVKKYGKN